jgi:thiamine biosynthesis lipoprotein
VGLEHPDDPTLAIGVANVKNRSICGSSGSRRKWDRFHHTINPHTLTSPTEIKAVWTIADTCMLADILSTALFLDPQPDLYKDFNFEYVLLYKDNTAEKSKDFPGELFTS